MRQRFCLKRLLTVSLAAVSFFGGAKQVVWADGGVPKRVLVRIRAGVDANALAARYGATVHDGVPNTCLYSLAPPAGMDEQAFVKQLSADPNALYAEQDTFINSPEATGDPFHFAFDRSLDPKTYNVTAQGPDQGGANPNIYTQINLGKSLSIATGNGIIVAVLDTGATFTHPALIGHYLGGYNTLQPNTLPYDLPDGFANIAVGHGTMVAGLIASIAPNAKILPVRVLDGDGIGSILNVAKGIDYAVTHGARVITMSFGTLQNSNALNDALNEANQAGVVLVASVGNDNLNRVQFPAVGHGTLAVAAVEANNVKSAYSNYGSFVYIVAPGTNLRSTYWDGGYATWSGTSFATPLVAGAAALMLSKQPGIKAGSVVNTILQTACSVEGQNPNYRSQLGKGVIDIESAVKAARP